MKSKKSLGNLEIGSEEISAIICALPLVLEMKADSTAQEELNAASVASAAHKLETHSAKFSAEEIRVVSAAITFAKLLLSGQADDLLPNIESEWKNDLSKHFFTYNRLDPIFQGFVDQILRRQ